MSPNNGLHNVNAENEVVCLIGVNKIPTVEFPEVDGLVYERGGLDALCIAFCTKYKEKNIQSNVRALSSMEALELMRQDFEEKLPELKKRIDDETNKSPAKTPSMDRGTNP